MLLLFLCLAASRAAQLPGLATARCIRTQHLRVVVLAYDRPASLGTLLGSLDAVASDRDDVHLHIHVDRPRPGASAAVRGGVRRTVAVARSFRWRYGPPPSIEQAATWRGVRRQWLAAWPSPAADTTTLILEDDLVLSPLALVWLTRRICAYGDSGTTSGGCATGTNSTGMGGAGGRSGGQHSHCLAGVTLQRAALRQSLAARDGDGATGRRPLHPLLEPPANANAPFLYRGVGPWGFAPLAEHWARFLRWYEMHGCGADLLGSGGGGGGGGGGGDGGAAASLPIPAQCDPRVGMEPTRYALWYDQARSRGRADALWTPTFAKFCSVAGLHTLYVPPHLTLANC